jgi:hypothetical protein
VGQQRLNVFQKAADIWAGLLPSPVTIVVRAQFDPQTCTATSAVLGSAGPSSLHRNFVGAPMANTWYHVAMASKFAGIDLSVSPAYDINATFNSNLNGSATCLGGTGWYYGYDGLEGTNIELLPVVLHELGHGLGFQTFVNRTTGAELGTPPAQFPDRYERYIYDNGVGLTWDNMTPAQRVTSAIGDNIVWNGPCVQAHSPYFLGPTPTTFINAGAPLAPKYVNGTAGFGPQSYSVTGNLVLVDDGVAPNSDGCTALVNAGAVSGNIAVIDRGVCSFVIKAQLAQAAGAIGVIIVNNVAGPAPALGGTDPSIIIPVVSVSLADGTAIKNALLGGPVNVTLGFDPSQLAGADVVNRPKLYAPNPLISGSSTSHWDVSATPHLLMEPRHQRQSLELVDLTFHHFIDMGWLPNCQNPIAVAISSFSASPTDEGVRLKARFYYSLANAAFVVVYRANGGSDDFVSVSTVNAPEDGNFSFVDASVEAGRGYRYKISVIDGDGEFFSQTADVKLPGARIELSQNQPNPFNPSTTIRFSLPASEEVGLAIYAADGKLVRMLVDGVRERGAHSATWDGRDMAGNPVSSGVYFYRLTAGSSTSRRRWFFLSKSAVALVVPGTPGPCWSGRPSFCGAPPRSAGRGGR